MPTPRKSLWDHHLEAVQLLARADVHLQWYESDLDVDNHIRQKDLIAAIRADINNYLKKKVPSA